MSRLTAVIVALAALVVGTCSDSASSPPSPSELQADLAGRGQVFIPTGDGFPTESRPDLVGIAHGAGMAGDPDWIYPGILTYAASPGAGVEHSVWVVHFPSAERYPLGGFGEPMITEGAVFVDQTTLAVILAAFYAGSR